MSQVSELEILINLTAQYFRLGMEAAGCENLTRLIDELSTLLGSFPEKTIAQLNEILATTFEAQARKDFLLVADLLEYEIAPLLNS